MIKFLKLTLAVKLECATDETGKGVWRATSESLNLTADGNSPDDALRILKEAILNAERIRANDMRVAKFDPKTNTSSIQETADAKEKQEKGDTSEEKAADGSESTGESTAGGRGLSGGGDRESGSGEGVKDSTPPKRKRGRPKKKVTTEKKDDGENEASD